MEVVAEQLSRVQGQELGTQEFQVAVLTALLQVRDLHSLAWGSAHQCISA